MMRMSSEAVKGLWGETFFNECIAAACEVFAVEPGQVTVEMTLTIAIGKLLIK